MSALHKLHVDNTRLHRQQRRDHGADMRGGTAFPQPQEALGSGSTHGLNTGERARS
jgi:hypothetical protein